MNVRIDAAGDDQQAVRVELLLPAHRTADLGYPAIPDPDISDLMAARDDDGAAADDKVKIRNSHAGILPDPDAHPSHEPKRGTRISLSPPCAYRRPPESADLSSKRDKVSKNCSTNIRQGDCG